MPSLTLKNSQFAAIENFWLHRGHVKKMTNHCGCQLRQNVPQGKRETINCAQRLLILEPVYVLAKADTADFGAPIGKLLGDANRDGRHPRDVDLLQ